MTKEEAIKFLQQLYPNGGNCWLDEQRIEAIGMAIQALQEEPVSTRDKLRALSDGKQHIGWLDDAREVEEESVSEDLGEYINELSKQFPEVSFAKLSRIAVRVAKWQKEQDQSIIELAEDHAMFAGMEKMKEQMMAKAIEGEILEAEDDDCAICLHTHLELYIEPDTLEKKWF